MYQLSMSNLGLVHLQNGQIWCKDVLPKLRPISSKFCGFRAYKVTGDCWKWATTSQVYRTNTGWNTYIHIIISYTKAASISRNNSVIGVDSDFLISVFCVSFKSRDQLKTTPWFLQLHCHHLTPPRSDFRPCGVAPGVQRANPVGRLEGL